MGLRRREIRPTQSGELRHRGDLQKLVTNPDGTPLTDAAGMALIEYQTYAEGVYFSIDDFSTYESFQAQQVGSELTTRIRVRFRPSLEGVAPNTMRMRLRLNPGNSPAKYDYYDIQGSIRDPFLRVEMQLTCIRRDVGGFRTGVTDANDP